MFLRRRIGPASHWHSVFRELCRLTTLDLVAEGAAIFSIQSLLDSAMPYRPSHIYVIHPSRLPFDAEHIDYRQAAEILAGADRVLSF